MNKNIILAVVALFFIEVTFGQEKVKQPITIGFQYFGELLFNPGLEIDYQFNIFEAIKIKKKRTLKHQLKFRPSITYYHLPNYTNNFIATPNFVYHLRTINNERKRYFFLEPYIKFGYQKYIYIGEVYETSNDGFSERKLRGGNSFVFGGGLSFGGSIKPNRVDWIFGTEYLPEISERALYIHHPVLKAGIRLKIQRK